MDVSQFLIHQSFLCQSQVIHKMPIFSFHTNVSNDKITPDLLKQISSLVARILHKPESYVAVHVLGDQNVIFAGTDEPCGYGVL
ncbi:Macrophage migration inhibitory factor protein, partial [Trichostrongylus colubriformis]